MTCRIAIWFIWLASGCLQGCVIRPATKQELWGGPDDARGAADSPGFWYKDAKAGIDVGATSNTKGRFQSKRDPTTGEHTIDATYDSNASNVVKEMPAWVTSMFPAMQANFQSANTRTHEITRQVDLLYTLIDRFGDKALAAIPILWPHGLEGAPQPSAGGPSPQEVLLEAILARLGAAPVAPLPVTPAPATP